MEVADIFGPHSSSEDSDPRQEVVILQVRLCAEPELLSVETAEPQPSCLHTTDDD